MTRRNGEGPLLRLTEHAEATLGRYRVEVALEGDGARRTATSAFELAISAQDREDLRWYLEDYLLFPLDPAPEIAGRVERRMAELGEALFKGVFAGSDAIRIWHRISDRLAETRVEVITDVRHAASVPWELLRDPEAATPLALEAHAFVRAYSTAVKSARGVEATATEPIRILLVICRPRGGEDVPFRSVARKLLDGLDKAAREVVTLDVLRPPSFDMLTRVLRDAKDRGEPYHVVHFDGHGAYTDDPDAPGAALPTGAGAHVLGHKGAHGYLVFESLEDAQKEDGQLVDGARLGKLLHETGVPVLVLNACRSAHADPPPEPEKAGAGSDVHDDVGSFGSLALEVMDKGVSGVVAMRYNVYVVTAAQFVADLYGALAGGLALGEAVTRGRKQLHDQPMRMIAYDPRKLEDWSVPIVYEAERLPLFPVPVARPGITLTLGARAGEEDREAMVGVPPAPDAGFFGRDETLLALDRTFDLHTAVLLHAYAGSGKSSAAAEFARWYKRTGGVAGPVLWTSFERRMTLPQVLDVVGRVFEPVLEQNGIQWLALDDGERRRVALQVLEKVPVLWIWDNVEPVAGFPAGTASAWTAEEQRELVDFLREARGTRAKFLLTSRRDEQAWLGWVPARVAMPPMPMPERVQLARALAAKRGARLDKVADWRPLLAFAQGNPMTITVLVGQALRDGMKTKEQVEAFVSRLRAGENAFDDDEKEGRLRSLGASLSYGFGSAFGEQDKRMLALLHLFQGFVQVETLVVMGAPQTDWCLPELRGLTRDAGMALLDRATEIGVLSKRGEGYYSIHPAAPWYFREMFEKHYSVALPGDQNSDATRATRAFVGAMSDMGNSYHDHYGEGHRSHLGILAAEESNLLHAHLLARQHKWWAGVISTMQGLDVLYHHTGQWSLWTRLLIEATPDFVDAQHKGLLPDGARELGIISQHLVRLAVGTRNYGEAQRLQTVLVSSLRERAAPLLASPESVLDSTKRSAIRTLAVALQNLGNVQHDCERADCVNSYTEAANMANHIGDRALEAGAIEGLGLAYMDLRPIRDLAEAERYFQLSLGMRGDEQRHDRARCLTQLGSVSFKRFQEAADEQPNNVARQHLDVARRYYYQALDLVPLDAMNDLAVIHNQIGNIHGFAGDLASALSHFHDSIRYHETQGDVFSAGQVRYNVASHLTLIGRIIDARAYALAALRNFETYGDRADDDIHKTHDILAEIDHLLSQTQPT